MARGRAAGRGRARSGGRARGRLPGLALGRKAAHIAQEPWIRESGSRNCGAVGALVEQSL